jgi:hypothetical protein
LIWPLLLFLVAPAFADTRVLGEYPQAQAEKLMADHVAMVRALLKPSIDPYLGENSLPKICREENLPKVQRGEDAKSIFRAVYLYSSKSGVLGLCSNPKDLVKTQYLILYCRRSRQLSVTRHFSAADQPWVKANAAACP